MDLPIEIFYYVTEFLPRESAIALALSCKKIFQLLNGVFQGLTRMEKWETLLLLERDHDSFAACQQCLKLHGAFSVICQRRCIDCRDHYKVSLPGGARPVLCRLLARRYLRGLPLDRLQAIAGLTRSQVLNNFKTFQELTFRMVCGSLLVRQQTLIAPLTTAGRLTSLSAYRLDAALHGPLLRLSARTSPGSVSGWNCRGTDP